jgi:hypothetical protein
MASGIQPKRWELRFHTRELKSDLRSPRIEKDGPPTPLAGEEIGWLGEAGDRSNTGDRSDGQ